MKPAFLPLALLVALAAAPSAALAGMTATTVQKVAFYAVGTPGFLDIEGVTKTITVADDGTHVTFSVPLAAVASGIDLRDDHMKNKYLEVAKFPSADLKVARAAITWPTNTGETSKGKATADFSVHGVTKPVEVLYTVRRSKIGYRVDAEFKFDAAAHGIAIPSEMGVTVDPKMSAKVTALDLADAP